MRTYTLADAGPRSASVMPLEDMDPFVEKTIHLTPEAWADFLRALADPPPISPALLRALERCKALGLAGDEEMTKEVGAMLALLAIGENENKLGDTSAAKDGLTVRMTNKTFIARAKVMFRRNTVRTQ